MFTHEIIKHISTAHDGCTSMCVDFTSISIFWKVFWSQTKHFDGASINWKIKLSPITFGSHSIKIYLIWSRAKHHSHHISLFLSSLSNGINTINTSFFTHLHHHCSHFLCRLSHLAFVLSFWKYWLVLSVLYSRGARTYAAHLFF